MRLYCSEPACSVPSGLMATMAAIFSTGTSRPTAPPCELGNEDGLIACACLDLRHDIALREQRAFKRSGAMRPTRKCVYRT